MIRAFMSCHRFGQDKHVVENQANKMEALFKQMVNHEDEIIFQNDEQGSTQEDDIFRTEEVRIEEMAIDGICGVY